MSDETTPPVGDAEAQVEEIFNNLTIDQMIINDIDTATTAREFRKIAHSALHSVCPLLTGRSGMSQQEKVEALATARDRAMLAVEALNKSIDLASQKETK